jgi:UDP-glucose 4-epimerase
LSDKERVLITGAHGPVGRALVRRLHRTCTVTALDYRPPKYMPDDVHCIGVDLRRRALDQLMRRRSFDVVIHAGVLTDLRRDDAVHHAQNVVAVNRLLAMSLARSVRKVIILSSARLYGHRPANTVFLDEQAPLLAGDRIPKYRDRVQMDLAGCVTAWREPSMEVVVARPVSLVGHGLARESEAMHYLSRKRPPVLMGFNPKIQLLHVEDFVSAIVALSAPGTRGPFNIAGPPPASLHSVLDALGARPIPVPRLLLEGLVDRLWALRASRVRPEELDFLQYSCIVSDVALRKATDYRPEFGLLATIAAVKSAY